MPTLGSLIIELGADLGRLRSDMSRVTNTVDGAMAKVRRSTQIATRALGGLGVGLSVAGFAGFVKQAINAQDELSKLAQRAGVTTEALSAFKVGAELSDVSLSQLTTGLQQLSRRMGDAARGSSETVEAFDQLKIAFLANGRLRNTEEVFTDIAEALSRLPDGAEKTELAMRLLGRAGAQLIPLLNGGREGLAAFREEAARTGQIVSSEAGRAAEEFNDSLTRLRQSVSGFGLGLASGIVPALNEMVDAMKAANAEGGVLAGILAGIKTGVRTIGEPLQIAKLHNEIARLRNLQGTKRRRVATGKADPDQEFALIPDFLGISPAQIEDERKSIERIARQIDDLEQQRDALTQRQTDRQTARDSGAVREFLAGQSRLRNQLAAPSRTDAPEPDKKALAAAESLRRAERDYVGELQKRIALQDQSGEFARVQADIEHGRAAAFSADTQERARALAKEIDLLQDTAEVHEYLLQIEQERRRDADTARKALAEERRATVESLRTPIEQYIDEVRRLVDLGLNNETLQRGIDRARTALEDTQQKTRDAKDAAAELGFTFSSAFEDAVLGAEQLQDVLAGLLKDIARIALRNLITDPLAKVLGEVTKGAGGSGGIISQFFGGARAAGGPVAAGRGYLVGERGPELFVPDRSGQIVPNGAGGVDVTIVNNAGAQVEAREVGFANGRRQLQILVEGALGQSLGSGRMQAAGLVPGLVSR